MRTCVLFCSLISSLLALGQDHEARYLEEKLIPAARAFIGKNGLAYGTNFGREAIIRYKVEFLTNRPAPFVMSSMRMENNYAFTFLDDNGTLEVRTFSDASVETYSDLSAAPNEKVEAVRKMALRNKLNDKAALALAKEHFRLQGHKVEDFHPVEFRQLSWGVKGDPDFIPYPFYAAEWYRSDVKSADREAGLARLPVVRIEISGITSNLLRYSKAFMPVGSDWEGAKSPNRRSGVMSSDKP
jgi:hypothetical protein